MAGKSWNEESKRRWAEKQRRLHAGDKGRTAEGGDGDPGDGARAGADRSRSGYVGRGGRDENRQGGGDGARDASQVQKATDKPLIDLPAVKVALPAFLIEYNELLDDMAQGISGSKWFKKIYYLKPLTPEKAQAEGEMLWPLIERMVPEFVGRHPVLAGLGMIFVKPLFRLRRKDKPKPKEGSNAQGSAQEAEVTTQ